MKILVINFSGKQINGNGEKIALYVKELLNNNKVQIINFKDMNINSCTHCNYECFINMNNCIYIYDDIINIYNYMLSSDLIINIIPIYGDLLCSNYFIFHERGQCYFDEEKYSKYLLLKQKFIIIGNSGIYNTYNIIKNDYKSLNDKNFLQLSSNKYKTKSINGDLITFSGIRREIEKFIYYMN